MTVFQKQMTMFDIRHSKHIGSSNIADDVT